MSYAKMENYCYNINQPKNVDELILTPTGPMTPSPTTSPTTSTVENYQTDRQPYSYGYAYANYKANDLYSYYPKTNLSGVV